MARATSPAEPGTIERLADWVLAVRAHDIADRAVLQAKLLLLDTIGCGIAARDDECARAVLATVDALGGPPQCTVIGNARKTSMPNAVLANGTLIRVLDLNDFYVSPSGDLGGHPSDNIPVALAAAEAQESSGRELIAAIVIGYEIFARCLVPLEEDSWDRSTISGLVAPAMAGRLMGLDRHLLANALALGGARAATPTVVRFGNISATKSIANALVAQSGVQAAMLAAAHVTGPLDLLEHAHGLKIVFPDTAAMAALTAPLSDAIMNCHIKAYPCLVTGQPVVAAGLEIHRLIGGDIARLRQIKLLVSDSPQIVRQLHDPGRINPASREAADHSFGFLAAVAVIDGKFGVAQFEGERWNDPKVRALMRQLEIVPDADLTRRAPDSCPCALHAVTLDGKEHRAEVLHPPGFSHGGLDAKAVTGKFEAITADFLARNAQQRIIEAVMGLDNAASCAALFGALAAKAEQARH
jgi:2-methylcitrate dehydratase